MSEPSTRLLVPSLALSGTPAFSLWGTSNQDCPQRSKVHQPFNPCAEMLAFLSHQINADILCDVISVQGFGVSRVNRQDSLRRRCVRTIFS